MQFFNGKINLSQGFGSLASCYKCLLVFSASEVGES
jgi:hypothetical protein